MSDPTWLANFRCHRRSASAYRRGRVLLAGDAVHIHTPAGGQGLNTGIMDAHNLAWKLALVASGRAPDSVLDSYGNERRPVADDVLRLTHALVRYGTMSHPIKRRARDTIIPALAGIPGIQRRAARRLTQVYVTYPPGQLVRPDAWRSPPRPGQRIPDTTVHLVGRPTTLYDVLRNGRHILIVPPTGLANVLRDGVLPSWRSDIDIVTGNGALAPWGATRGTAPLILVRPDGHVAVRAGPGDLRPVIDYLRDLFSGPAGVPSQLT